ncbi:MAG: sigma-70 family RNA polymerase sigma factor [Lachnospiraceae bacterium]|nr:sigma-70 family RNA polymerase sigma factor [Lachnospiraceae bacterium]
MEDNQIIDLFFQRNQQGIAETDRKYSRYLQAIAYRILGNREDAEECVNDALNSAWNSIPPQKPTVFRMFLAKLTRNRAINRYNEEHAKKRGSGEMTMALEELSECIAGGSDPEKTVLAEELSKEIRAFVRALPEREGDVFLRRYFFLEDVKSIALRYGISQNNVSVILNRTRKKLHDHLLSRHFL